MQQVKEIGALEPSRGATPTGRVRPDAGVSVPGMMSMLSLFLLLLAFFLMLNSLSQYEAQRTQAAIDSLNSTFKSDPSKNPTRIFGSYVGTAGAVEDLQAEITGLLRTLLGFDKFEIVRDGPLLSAIIDADALFTDDASGTPLLQDLAAKMAVALNKASAVALLDIFAYARLPNVKTAGDADIEISAIRSGALIRAFAKAGVRDSLLTTGLETGDPKKIRLQFHLVEEKAAR